MTAPASHGGGERERSEVATREGSARAAHELVSASKSPLRSTQDAAGAWSRARITSPVVQGLLALAAYLAVWLLTKAFPLVAHAGRPQLDQSSMDPNFYAWSLRWWPYAVSHGLNPLHTTLIGAPSGFDLAWITTVPPLALLLSPVTAVAGPVVSLNLLAAVGLPLSAWAAYVLCRRLTGRFWPALAGGAVYGFSAYQINHYTAAQLNLTFSLLLPLMGYLVLLWRDRRISPRVFIGLLALAMVAQFYLFLETFADMTALWAAALLAGYALAGRPGRPAVARLSRHVCVAYLVTIVFVGPYMAYAATHVPKGFARSPATSALNLASLVVPRPGQTFGVSWLARHAAHIPVASMEGYVGVPLLVLAVALAIVTWSSRTTRFLAVMLAFIILVSLGPTLKAGRHEVVRFPWAHIWYLPIVRSAYPARLMLFAFLALAVMTALWLAGPSRMPRARWLLAVLALGAIAADMPALRLPAQPGLPAFITTGEYRHYLTPGETVVVASGRGNAGMLWQAETNFYTRLAGGFVNAAIADRTDLPLPVAGLARRDLRRVDVRRFVTFLRRARVGAIMVEASSPERWPAILRRLGLRGTTVGGVVLYRDTHSWRHVHFPARHRHYQASRHYQALRHHPALRHHRPRLHHRVRRAQRT